MTLVKFSPFRKQGLDRVGVDPSFGSLWSEVNDLFNHFQTGVSSSSQAMGFVPAIDVKETPKALLLHAELPGLSEQDVDVSIHEGVLTLKGEKKSENKKEDENHYYVERSFGSFSRSFTLPTEVNEDEVEAVFSKGVLTVTLPKSKEAKTQKKITIKAQ